MLQWNRWYSIRSYLRSSLWIIPFVAFLTYLVLVRVIDALDAWVRWAPVLPYGPAGVTLGLQTVITFTVSFLVFTFGSLLVAIQVASGQLTPRIIATTLLRDNAIRFSVGLFILSLLFATGAIVRLDSSGAHLIVPAAFVLGLASIATFLFLIDYAARLLRPVSIVRRVGEEGLAAIKDIYPDKVAETPAPSPARRPHDAPPRIFSFQGQPGVILAMNLEALVALARNAGGIIEVVPQVGDFLGVGDPVFRLHGGAGDVDDSRLGAQVALGAERTIEQDATFAFRIIVDIGIKALSQAINDPTTAVLALDQLHRLLRAVGLRHLRGEEIRDETGKMRVIFSTPNWEDFVQLSCREIRHYGARNFQVARRMRAMLENLLQTLPDNRHPALREELNLLDSTLPAHYPLPQDLALARVADTQGLGGAQQIKR